MAYATSITIECASCCGQQCTQLECRRRGGEVKLCGHREYPGYESTPPRFYLRKQLGGLSNVCTCVPQNCDNIPFADPRSCTVSGTGSNGCSYTATAEILDIFDAGGGNYKYTGKATFASALGPCEVLATARQLAGALFYFGSSNGGTTQTFNTTTTSPCVPGGDTPVLGIVTVNVDVPGIPGGIGCSVTAYARPAYPVTTKIVSYEGEITFDPLVSCDVPTINTGKRINSECVSLLCKDSHADCGSTTELSVTSAFEIGDTYLDSFLGARVTNGFSITQGDPTPCGGGSGAAAEMGSERYEQLELEDTDEDAIARLLDGPAGDWSAWTTVGDGTGGTCINPPCCLAKWGIRTDQTFDYFEAEYRGRVTGLTPGTQVDITIRAFRRPAGSLVPFVQFADMEYDGVTADGSGVAEVTGVVPNDEGFETFVRCIWDLSEP